MATTFFKDKKCLLTGAASGIGKATAIELAIHGAILFLTDINDNGLQETVDFIKSNNGKVGAYKAFDIAKFEQVKFFAEELHAQHGAMDVVMNIAGISAWGAVDKMPHEEWNNIIDINLKGPIHIIESFVPAMMQQQKGHIVNVSSAAGLFGLPWHGAYSASKYGLRGLTDVLRNDLKRHNIRVHLVCPGAVDTGLVHTIKISGITISDAEMQQLKSRFQKHAISPKHAAQKILKGIERNNYLIFTSLDIRFGYWTKQKFTFLYEFVMQKMNDYFQNTLTGK
jgi:NAD(P)-dependent dehydrogenase (short-subunit alcohol dehydrogenase family)